MYVICGFRHYCAINRRGRGGIFSDQATATSTEPIELGFDSMNSSSVVQVPFMNTNQEHLLTISDDRHYLR